MPVRSSSFRREWKRDSGATLEDGTESGCAALGEKWTPPPFGFDRFRQTATAIQRKPLRNGR